MRKAKLADAKRISGGVSRWIIVEAAAAPMKSTLVRVDSRPIIVNDLKIIEARNLLRGIAGGGPASPGFDEGLRVQQVMEAMERSHDQGWVRTGTDGKAS